MAIKTLLRLPSKYEEYESYFKCLNCYHELSEVREENLNFCGHCGVKWENRVECVTDAIYDRVRLTAPVSYDVEWGHWEVENWSDYSGKWEYVLVDNLMEGGWDGKIKFEDLERSKFNHMSQREYNRMLAAKMWAFVKKYCAQNCMGEPDKWRLVLRRGTHYENKIVYEVRFPLTDN